MLSCTIKARTLPVTVYYVQVCVQCYIWGWDILLKQLVSPLKDLTVLHEQFV